MKTRAALVVRDALAATFTAACAGDTAAGARVQALERWAAGAGDGSGLAELRGEDGALLFAGDALDPRFAALEPYARDRAPRYAHALRWIHEAGATGVPLECARAAWDAGLFFEVHELLEPSWLQAREPHKSVLQGLIMAGAALHHLAEGNRTGALSLLREAARRLRANPQALPALALERFAHGLEELATALAAGRVRGVADLAELPRLELTDAEG